MMIFGKIIAILLTSFLSGVAHNPTPVRAVPAPMVGQASSEAVVPTVQSTPTIPKAPVPPTSVGGSTQGNNEDSPPVILPPTTTTTTTTVPPKGPIVTTTMIECVLTVTDSLGNTMQYSPPGLEAVNGVCPEGTPLPIQVTYQEP